MTHMTHLFNNLKRESIGQMHSMIINFQKVEKNHGEAIENCAPKLRADIFTSAAEQDNNSKQGICHIMIGHF